MKNLEKNKKNSGFSLKEIAQQTGYKNLNKGIRRIKELESGNIDEQLVQKIMSALEVVDLDRKKCQLAEELQIKREIKKLPEFKAKLFWRAMSCVYIPLKIPEYLTSRAAILNFTKDFARERKAHCRLELDYNLRYYFSPSGEVSKPDRRFNRNRPAKPALSSCF
jgi:transcriptional regulator with XRE-family HTH domain